MWDQDIEMPTQRTDGRSRCFCGAEVTTELSLGTYRNLTAASVIQKTDHKSGSRAVYGLRWLGATHNAPLEPPGRKIDRQGRNRESAKLSALWQSEFLSRRIRDGGLTRIASGFRG